MILELLRIPVHVGTHTSELRDECSTCDNSGVGMGCYLCARVPTQTKCVSDFDVYNVHIIDHVSVPTCDAAFCYTTLTYLWLSCIVWMRKIRINNIYDLALFHQN